MSHYDYQEDHNESDREGEVTCKFCGTEDLTWYDLGNPKRPDYRLFATGANGRLVPHVCSTKQMADNAFEDESHE